MILSKFYINSYYYNAYSIGYADGLANALDNMDVSYTYHHHNNSCRATCTISTVWDYSSVDSGRHCTGDHVTPGHEFHCYTGTETHSSNGACDSAPVSMAFEHLSSGIPYNTTTSHVYYTCGRSEGEIIEVRLVPKG